MSTFNSDIAFLESLDEPALLWDAELRLRWCSPATVRLLGWPLEELRGKTSNQLPFIEDQDRETFTAALRSATSGIDSPAHEIDTLHKLAGKIRITWQHIKRVDNSGIKLPPVSFL